jgi:mRNA interferase MazF
MEEKTIIRQGDVYSCALGARREGSEQEGVRPCVIVSNDVNNKFSTMLIVVPITSREKKDLPTHFKIDKHKYSFFDSEENIVLTEQVRCIASSRLIKKIGELDEKDLDNVIYALNVNFEKFIV